ncbi:hypothetical protein [Schumannella soli]|uniref:hypothetical protein n=1 Tax=Schumannella soli TaxID=2590779 RepID=UPI0021083B4C|nr:hypothetical protein [Schumannella soli]
MILRIVHALRRRDPESGVALPVVFGLGLIMLVLVATSMSAAISSVRKTDTDDDWNAALDIAYAGVEDYTSRLANDPSYQYYGNPASKFTQATGSSVTLPPVNNDAFAVTGDKWGSMPNNAQAGFRYEVDNSQYASSGRLRIRATGKVSNEVRSVVADLHQSGFLDYMYFTVYEVQDPDISGKTGCAMYQYDGRPDSLDCDIDFGANDTLNGPVHSNDRLSICGAKFNDRVTSSDPAGKTSAQNWTKPANCSNPTWKTGAEFNPSSRPVYRAQVPMPDSNADLRRETFTDRPAQVPDPGCLYTGPTIITFNTGGTMTVNSPWTKFTSINEAGVGNNDAAKCGSIAALTSAAGATIPTIPNNLIYVQSVPTSGTDPNKRAAGDPAYPAIVDCSTTSAMKQSEDGTTVISSGFKYNGTTDSVTGSAYQYPLSNEVLDRFDSSLTNPAYDCKSGDVYVRGNFSGKMTIAAARYVYVTGDIKYDSTSDMLGVVGDSAVWVWNPIVKNGNTYSFKKFEDRRIDGALLSVKHTVQVQNVNGVYKWGASQIRCNGVYTNYATAGVNVSRKTLTINGTLVQKFRGSVASTVYLNGCNAVTGAGFDKAYGYDTRFKINAPPKFLKPTSITYNVSQFATTKTAYTATGAQIP